MERFFEPAPSARAKCRGCGRPIAKGELRFGECMPSPFREGRMTLWFHPLCGAYKRPEPFLEALSAIDVPIDDRAQLGEIAQHGIAHRRLPRADSAGRSPSGRARCRSCREMIAKDGWRVALVYYQEGLFEASGFIHLRCTREYFGTTDLLDRLRHFSGLSDDDVIEIRLELEAVL